MCVCVCVFVCVSVCAYACAHPTGGVVYCSVWAYVWMIATLVLPNVNVCVFSPHSFGRQLGGRRGCECITLEPSEMIVVSKVSPPLSLPPLSPPVSHTPIHAHHGCPSCIRSALLFNKAAISSFPTWRVAPKGCLNSTIILQLFETLPKKINHLCILSDPSLLLCNPVGRRYETMPDIWLSSIQFQCNSVVSNTHFNATTLYYRQRCTV